MTYISKYQQRKQTIASSKITSLRSIERYDVFYDLAYEGIKKNAFPIMSIPAGRLLMRKTGVHPSGGRHFNIEESRTIPPERFSALSNSVRYSGVRLDGKPGQGVLYMATLAGVLREMTHYDTRDHRGSNLSLTGSPDTTRSHMEKMKTTSSGITEEKDFPFHLYKLNHQVAFADIRATSLSVFLNQARPPGDGGDSYSNDLRLMSVYDGNDYSAARGIADAVYDAGAKKGIQGVCADSSRTDTDMHLYLSNHGDNTGGMILAMFGQPSETIRALEPVKSFPDFKALAEHVQRGSVRT